MLYICKSINILQQWKGPWDSSYLTYVTRPQLLLIFTNKKSNYYIYILIKADGIYKQKTLKTFELNIRITGWSNWASGGSNLPSLFIVPVLNEILS